MRVPVVQVRVMGVAVCQRDMLVPVRMGLARWVVRAMAVLVVGVVRVAVLMLHAVMRVVMLMPLGQVQPQA